MEAVTRSPGFVTLKCDLLRSQALIKFLFVSDRLG